jgi:hypothetical protein
MDKIRCPHLLKRVAYRCCTVDESYSPSNFQLREYCTTDRYSICPFHLGLQARQPMQRVVEEGNNKFTAAD